MPLYTVHHTTAYRFRRPVKLGQHQMLFRPRDSFDQRLLASASKCTLNQPKFGWIHDVFGNCVTLVDFNISAEALEFETTIHLEHTPENTPTFGSRSTPESTPSPTITANCRIWSRTSAAIFEMTERSTIGCPSSLRPANSRPTGQLLMTLNEAISEGFSYRRQNIAGYADARRNSGSATGDMP